MEPEQPGTKPISPVQAPAPDHKYRRVLLVAGLILVLLSGGAYGAIQFLGQKSTPPPSSPTATPAPPLTADEQTKVKDSRVGSSLLTVTEVAADRAELGVVTTTTLQVAGDLTVGGSGGFGGTIRAANFQGGGTGLTGVNAALLNGQPGSFYQNLSNLTGTLKANQLPAEAALRNSSNTFTAPNTFTGGLTVNGNFTATGPATFSTLALGTPLAVSSGGTGLSSVSSQGVLYGQSGGSLGVAVPASSGLCLVSGATDISWGVCGGGGAGVASVNGLTGVISIANASAAGSTVTINDASTAAKGLAQFNATNFSVSGGVVNTIQDIASSASPTFNALTATTVNANTLTPSSALTVGAIAQALTLQGSTTTIASHSGANATTLSFQAPTANVTYRLLTTSAGTYDICTTAGNCVGAGGGVSTAGGTTNHLAKFTGVQAIGDSLITDNGTLVTVSGNFSVTGSVSFSSALSIANGGTGSGTAAGARGNLGAAASGANADITSLSGLTTALSVGQGGTGATSFTSGGVILGQGTGALVAAAASSAGQCFVSTAGDPAFQTCPVPAGSNNYIQNTTVTQTADFHITGTGTASKLEAYTLDNPGDVTNLTIGGANSTTVTIAKPTTISSTLTVNTITPTAALTIGSTGQALTLQGNAASVFTTTGSGFTTTLGFTGTPTGAVTYNFDRAATPGTYAVCTTAGNCTGVGGGVTTAGGTTNAIPKFTGAQVLGDSIISDNGSTVTIAGTLAVNTITPTGAFVIGHTAQNLTLQGAAVSLTATNGGTTNTLTFATPSGGAKTITVPDATGTLAVSATGPLSLDASGNLTCATCVTSGGGGGGVGAVDSLNGLTGALSIANATGSGSTVTINDASTSQKGIAQFNGTNFTASSGLINTVQDISTTASPIFASLSTTGYMSPQGGILFPSDNFLQTTSSNRPTDTTGLIVPLYIYPTDVYNNVDYNNLIAFKKKYHNVPVTAIINPASGPGASVDPNYTAAIKRLHGAGITLVGYVDSSYTTRTQAAVEADIDTWLSYYPGIDGIFIDQSTNDADSSHYSYYAGVTAYAHSKSLYPVIDNPGTDVVQGYFDNKTADIINIYENSSYPTEAALKGDAAGGYSDYRYHQRSLMVYNQGTFDYSQLKMMRQYVGNIFITSDIMPNPWDSLPSYMENLFQSLDNAGEEVIDKIFVQDTLSINGTLVVNTITPTTALTVGATNQTLTLQGDSASAITASSGANTTTLNFVSPTANTTISVPALAAGSYTLCTSSGNCAGVGVTLQGAYDNGNTISTTNARSLAFNLTDQATDPNFVVDLQCVTSCANNGRFAVQNSGTDVFAVSPNGGAIAIQNTANSTSAFNLKVAGGGNLFTIDTTNSQVGINLGSNNTPSLADGGLQVQGVLRVTGGGFDNFATPAGASLTTKIGVDVQSPSNFGQVMALGIDSSTIDTARVLSLFDARTVPHQPSLAVLSPDENGVVGFSWDGSNTTARVITNHADSGASTSRGLVLQSGNVTNSTGTSGDVQVNTGSTSGTTSGNLYVVTGDGTGANSSSGNLTLDTGAKTGSGTTGTLTIGGLNASAVNIGRLTGGATTIQAGSGGVFLQAGATGGSDFIQIGVGGSGSTTPDYLALDVKSTSGDPAGGAPGYMYYNAATNKFRCYQGAAWTDCILSGASSAFVQDGNSFGAAATLGTNDNNDLNVETNGVTRLTIESDGSQVTFASNVDLIMQGSSAFISNPQGQTNGESLGASATVTGANGTAIGNTATAVGNAVAIGYQAGTLSGDFGGPISIGQAANGGSWGVAIGQAATNGGNNNIAIGNGANAAGDNGIAIGKDTVANQNGIAIGTGATTGGNARIVLGRDATATADNQMVVGSDTIAIDHVIVGSGVSSATPVGFTLQATGGSGTNIAGASINIASGAGTGSANGGNINLQVATPGVSGTSANVPATVASISGTNGSALFKNLVNSANAFRVQNAAATATVFNVDTINQFVGIGTSAPAAQLDVAGLVPTAALNSITTSIDNPYDMVAVGRYLYVAVFGKLRIYDITRPNNLVSISSVNTTTGISWVQVQGKYAYVTVNSGTVYIIDISNPASPSVANSISISSLNGTFVRGRYLYATTSDGSNNIKIYDIANPTAPVLLSSLAESNAGSSTFYVSDRYLYTTAGVSGNLYIIDISNPASPTNVSTSLAVGGVPTASQGRYLWIADSFNNRIRAIDVSNPSSPSITGSFSTGGPADKIVLQGRYAYVALENPGNGIQVVNVSNPASMSNVGTMPAGGSTRTLAIQGRYLYTGDYTNCNIESFDLGGTYTQQLEAGGIEAGSISSDGSLSVAGSTNIQGSLNTGQSAEIGGGLGVAGPANFQNTSNTTAAFQIQNSSGQTLFNADTTNNTLAVLGGVANNLSSWSSTTALPTANYRATAAMSNGYLYYLGGFSAGGTLNTVQTARPTATGPIPSSGNPGTWTAQSNLIRTGGVTDARSSAGTVVAGGYVYLLGGYDDTAGDATSSVVFAKLNADGTTGTWQDTTALPAARYRPGAVYLNGYVYVMGGTQTYPGNTSPTPSAQTTVYWAKVNADGSLSSWTTGTSGALLPAARAFGTAVTTNGYIYYISGAAYSGGVTATPSNTVYYARPDPSTGAIPTSGTGTWAAESQTLPAGSGTTGNTGGPRVDAASVVVNGYIFLMGGNTNSLSTANDVTSIYTAKLNADGTTGAWALNSSTLPGTAHGGASAAVWNGYIYFMGGSANAGGTFTSSVYYASTARLQVAGSLDLVGLQDGNSADPGSQTAGASGGSITAGNGNFVGSLQVQGQATFSQSVAINGGLNLSGALSATGAAFFQDSVASTTAFVIQSSSGASLFTVDTTSNQRIYIGPTAGDTTGTLLVLGKKTNAGDPAGVTGAMYYNASSKNFRCYEVDHWSDCLINGRTGYHKVFEMGAGDIRESEFTSYTVNGSVSQPAGVTGHPGITQYNTNTSASGYGYAGSQADNMVQLGGGDYWRYETVLRLPSTFSALSSLAERYIILAGFTEQQDSFSAGDPVDGCYFEYTDNVNGGKWQGTCRSNSTVSTCDTGNTVAMDTWYRLAVVVNAAGTQADFRINGTSACTVTSNIPTAAGRATGFGDSIQKTIGTTDRDLDVDYEEIESQFGTPR